MTTPFRFFPVRVKAIEDLTPGFRRFTFADPSLASFADPGFDQRIKLLFPIEGIGYEALMGAEDWYGTWRALPDGERHPLRTYTTRYVRAGEQELDVDVVVHGVVGPASRWIEYAEVGDELLILGPNAEYEGEPGGVDFVPPERTDRFLIAGDETAAPAIAVALEQLPDSARGIAVVEVPETADAAYLPAHPGIEVRAVARDGREHGEALIDATRAAVAELAPAGEPQQVEEIDIDSTTLWEVPRHAKGGAALKRTSLYAWLAGEAGAVKTLRRHLVSERGIDRRSVAFMGYWRIGKAEN
ncbi:siderophore-interacting protein [Gulosibacter sp. 10]|uniref:siderophore-interacting protein n=1 Tax=Gulosibacter sp. 10 TaxID=1255570 RepID=UPI00097F0F4F|nr:siderophore-interacting protein [Gulosibacter sp. 10]SJM58266.1 Siderophore-interacting protein [Gulosibacter sp. 10]